MRWRILGATWPGHGFQTTFRKALRCLVFQCILEVDRDNWNGPKNHRPSLYHRQLPSPILFSSQYLVNQRNRTEEWIQNAVVSLELAQPLYLLYIFLTMFQLCSQRLDRLDTWSPYECPFDLNSHWPISSQMGSQYGRPSIFNPECGPIYLLLPWLAPYSVPAKVDILAVQIQVHRIFIMSPGKGGIGPCESLCDAYVHVWLLDLSPGLHSCC